MTPQQRLGAVVVGAPVALAIAVFVHPHDTEDAVQSLELVDEQRVRWVVAHALEPFAWLAIAVVVYLAGGILVRRSAGVIRFGGSLAAIGAAGMALMIYAHGEAIRFMSEEPSEYADLTRVYDRFYEGLPLVGLLAPAFHLGMVLLGVGLIRSGAVPRWAGAALVVAPVAIVALGASLSPQWAAIVIGAPLVIGFAGLRSAIVATFRPITSERFVL